MSTLLGIYEPQVYDGCKKHKRRICSTICYIQITHSHARIVDRHKQYKTRNSSHHHTAKHKYHIASVLCASQTHARCWGVCIVCTSTNKRSAQFNVSSVRMLYICTVTSMHSRSQLTRLLLRTVTTMLFLSRWWNQMLRNHANILHMK